MAVVIEHGYPVKNINATSTKNLYAMKLNTLQVCLLNACLLKLKNIIETKRKIVKV